MRRFGRILNDDFHAVPSLASSTPTSSLTWITWFCSLPGHEYFCEVTEDFIEDDFNLTGLNALVPFWKEAMEMVLDVEPGPSQFIPILMLVLTVLRVSAQAEDALKIPDVSIVESSAELLYGLVHQRYILTRPGLQAMVRRSYCRLWGDIIILILSLRLKNMKLVTSVFVHECIVNLVPLPLVVAQISLDWIL